MKWEKFVEKAYNDWSYEDYTINIGYIQFAFAYLSCFSVPLSMM